MDVFWEWFRWLYDETGINFSVFYDPFHRAAFADAFLMTVRLVIFNLFLSSIIGLIGALLLNSRFALVRGIIRGYVQFFRNTPKLVQLYCFFFGIGAMLPRVDDGTGLVAPILSAVALVVISFSFYYGAFNVEVFRSGIEAVPDTTVEAAKALGMNKFQVYRLVVIPLAFRICLPAFHNSCVFVVKGTSLAYTVGVAEMLYVSSQIYALDGNVPEMMNLLLVCYVSLVSLFVYFMNKLERALKMPGYGT